MKVSSISHFPFPLFTLTHCDEVCRITFSRELMSGSIHFLIHILTFHSFCVGAVVDLERSQACSRGHLSKSSSYKAPTSPTQTCQYNINDQMRWAMILQKSHELSSMSLQNSESRSRSTQATSLHFQCPLCFLAHPSQACLNDHMRKAHAVLI